jgi:hypothetical protein
LPGDVRIKQKNNSNLEYVGPLYMGSLREKVAVVYDTGSSWLTIADELCDKSCNGLVYYSSNSTDFIETDKPIRQ